MNLTNGPLHRGHGRKRWSTRQRDCRGSRDAVSSRRGFSAFRGFLVRLVAELAHVDQQPAWRAVAGESAFVDPSADDTRMSAAERGGEAVVDGVAEHEGSLSRLDRRLGPEHNASRLGASRPFDRVDASFAR